ncbi:M23 family metallopeptidase [Cellulophaga sp. BC115SP]|uniref:M23 family metallopeptidase n=1 Tax=Cellulophaga sp. BC115SP TaxID=2683263 RepID=UPI001413226F|nr:M23 family metallopeptidase [Cellulophaga sp. BC115SP]NBB29927.1 peptidoglycan DD-metalloendopeptidase family protein [Cellulophaga sp. BC115SP]
MARLVLIIVIIFSYHSASAQKNLDSLLCQLDNPQIVELLNSTDSSLKAQVLTLYEFKLPIYQPLSKLWLNSNFGFRIHPLTRQLQFHQGIDLKASLDQQVFATADGIILHSGYSRSLGYFIKIQHLAGFTSIYGHLNRIFVITNQSILQGQIIGTCGRSGKTTGVHLHYAIVRNQQYLSPSLILHKD